MASTIEKKVQEATDELHSKKESEGVEVRTPEKSIVRKAVSSIDEEMECVEAEEGENLEDQITDIGGSGNRAPDEKSVSRKRHEHSGSLISRIKSIFTGKSTETTARLEAKPVHDETDSGPVLDTEDLEKELDAERQALDDETVNSPEEIGEIESLDDLEEMPGVEDEDVEAELALQEELGIDTGDYERDGTESEERADVSEQETGSSTVEPDDGEAEMEVTPDEDVEVEVPVEEPTHEEHREESAIEPEVEGEEAPETRDTAETDTAPTTPESTSEKRDALEKNLNDLEEKISGREKGSRNEELNERIKKLEEKMVSSEAQELGKINELEQRVERMELEDDSDLEERIARLEDRIETIKTPQQIDDRLTELEDVVMNPDRRIRDIVDEELRGEIEEIKETVKYEKQKLEAEIERLGKDQKEADRSMEELRSYVKEFREETAEDEKLERLWEAMDEELLSLEDRVHENEVDVDELMSTMVELTELVKAAMDQ